MESKETLLIKDFIVDIFSAGDEYTSTKRVTHVPTGRSIEGKGSTRSLLTKFEEKYDESIDVLFLSAHASNLS